MKEIYGKGSSKNEDIITDIFEKAKQKLASIGKNIDNEEYSRDHKYMTYEDNSDYSHIDGYKDLDFLIDEAMRGANSEKNKYLKFCIELADKIESGEMKAEDIGGKEVADLLENVWWDSADSSIFPQIYHIIQLSEHLDKNKIISKNDLMLSMMEHIYNYKVRQFLRVVKFDAKEEYEDIIFDIPCDINKRQEQYSKWNVEQWIDYEQGKEKYIENYFEKKFGRNNPMPKKTKGFYEEDWDKHSWTYVIVESIFEEFGVAIDKEQVKSLFFERAKQKIEGCKEHIRKLQVEDKELDNQIAEEKRKDTQAKE